MLLFSTDSSHQESPQVYLKRPRVAIVWSDSNGNNLLPFFTPAVQRARAVAATKRLSKAALAMSMSAKVRSDRKTTLPEARRRAGGWRPEEERKKGGSEARATKERRSPKARSHSGVQKPGCVNISGPLRNKSQWFVHSKRGFSMRRRPTLI